LLLDTGKVDAAWMDKDGQTPLHLAAGNGHETVVKLLLDTGKVDAAWMDKGARTPLFWAAENGHEAIVKLLIERAQKYSSDGE
jgi:ankyrin repeat protein